MIRIGENRAGVCSGSVSPSKVSDKNKWKLTASLKEQIAALAKKDVKNNVYMGNDFMNLRKAEVGKVAPNRAALMGKFQQTINSDTMKEIQEADKRWLCMMFGEPYEAQCQESGTGSAVHIYNEAGEEVLTYTQGVGWHEKETKAESKVHSELKAAYYEAYHAERKALNAELKQVAKWEGILLHIAFLTVRHNMGK